MCMCQQVSGRGTQIRKCGVTEQAGRNTLTYTDTHGSIQLQLFDKVTTSVNETFPLTCTLQKVDQCALNPCIDPHAPHLNPPEGRVEGYVHWLASTIYCFWRYVLHRRGVCWRKGRLQQCAGGHHVLLKYAPRWERCSLLGDIEFRDISPVATHRV